MLNPLRRKLTLMCVLVTGVLLTAMAVTLLFMSEKQMDRQSEITFQNNLNSILYKLQSSRVIDNTYLSQLESGNRLIVYIEDNGNPLLFPGVYRTETPRQELLSAAAKTALSYGLDPDVKPYSVLNVRQVTFPLTGSSGDRYQAAVAVIPSSSGWQSVTLLRDLSEERSDRRLTRVFFFVSIFCSLGFLFGFSYWFSGRAIRPVEESRRKQVEFISAASHELRSPLTVIQASASAFADADDPEQRSIFFSTIRRECGRMSRLIEDMLLLANSDAQTWSLHAEPVEADTLLMDIYDSFFPLSRQQHRALTLSLPDGICPPTVGDRQRLFQALSILVNNAFSYTQEDGHIHLSLTYTDKFGHGDAILLSVEDDGIGISDEDKAKIFDRFYRVDPSRSKKDHYGLGLSIAREIVSLHGGTLSVCNGSGGRGSRFTIRLPLTTPAKR